jgi:hypothetical protein
MSSGVLFDYEALTKSNKVGRFRMEAVANLKTSVPLDTLMRGMDSVGVIVIVPTTVATKLKTEPIPSEMMNSNFFVRQIQHSVLCAFSTTHGRCEVFEDLPIDNVGSFMAENKIRQLYVYAPMYISQPYMGKSLLDNYLRQALSEPVITVTSVSGIELLEPKLRLVRTSSSIPPTSMQVESSRNLIKYILSHVNLPTCSMKIKLTPKAVETLKTILHKSSTKELSGAFILQPPDADSVFQVDVDLEKTLHGLVDSVDVPPSRYHYHTHPEAAYTLHNAVNGFPSVSDYIAVLQSAYAFKTIFHVVATLEGLYIISMGRNFDWTANESKRLDMIRYIDDNFHIDKRLSIDDYFQQLSTLQPIFVVTYLQWTNAGTMVEIPTFSKSDSLNCNPLTDGSAPK